MVGLLVLPIGWVEVLVEAKPFLLVKFLLGLWVLRDL